jgi:molecular chaperone GrpE
MWRSLIDWVLAGTYVIDEKPFDVVASLRQGDVSSEEPSAGLLQAITTLLVEREQWLNRAQELESRVGDSQQVYQVVKNLIPVLDAMDRVLAFARQCPPSEELDNWLKSIEGIYFRLHNTLERVGLERLETVGKDVDLNCQEVVEYIPSIEHPHDSVVSERQKGYRFRGKLIRDAKVVVAYNPKDR